MEALHKVRDATYDLRDTLASANAVEALLLLPLVKQATELAQGIETLASANRQASEMATTIAIEVDGGLITDVYSDKPARYILIDHDNLKSGEAFDGSSEPAALDPVAVARFATGKI